MPILGKSDDVRGGRKAKARHGRCPPYGRHRSQFESTDPTGSEVCTHDRGQDSQTDRLSTVNKMVLTWQTGKIEFVNSAKVCSLSVLFLLSGSLALT